MKGIGIIRGAFGQFVRAESFGSICLIVATLTALVWANSRWSDLYFQLLGTPVGLSWGGHAFTLSLRLWVNDALMAVFFFVVGLEIKREILAGHLSRPRKALLPIFGAMGGMVVPAGTYLIIAGSGETAHGWGIPMATDIAFALGVLSLFGNRVPLGLKVFLSALAIVDDIGAVLVIALFYTAQVHWDALLVALACLSLLFWTAQSGKKNILLYVAPIIGIWIAILLSGIHATIAGILVSLIVPVRARIEPEVFRDTVKKHFSELEQSVLTRDSMLHDYGQLDTIVELDLATRALRPPGITIERFLHPFQAFFILPVFALCNAGVRFDRSFLEMLASPVSLGVIAGLVLGKQLGILLFSWAAVRIGGAEMPEGATWTGLYGASCVAGIGFTMSLFVGDLAFSSESLLMQAKAAVLVASLVAALWGYLVLAAALRRP